MAVSPTRQMMASREEMQREFDAFQAAAGGKVSYGTIVAQWLAGQLPGADIAAVGWGIILVSAMLYPAGPADPADPAQEKAHPGRRAGQRLTIMLASRVGEALLETAVGAVPSGQAFEVGPELTQFDVSGIYAEATGLPSSGVPGTDPAVLRREFHQAMGDDLIKIRQSLENELPGANLAATGWGLTGTGSRLLVEVGKVDPPRRLRLLRAGARRRDNYRSAAMNSALSLASLGDYLADPTT
jgi:hypothetical protein